MLNTARMRGGAQGVEARFCAGGADVDCEDGWDGHVIDGMV